MRSFDEKKSILRSALIDTPLGSMIAIGDEEALYLLEFVDRRHLEQGMGRLKEKTGSTIIPGDTSPINAIKKELSQYFEGTLKEFKTPLILLGSPFQKSVWEELRKIPWGETKSYSEIALAMGKPTAHRAVAGANGANRLALIIPCHRVIHLNGEIGGYAASPVRKKWLLRHERKITSIMEGIELETAKALSEKIPEERRALKWIEKGAISTKNLGLLQ